MIMSSMSRACSTEWCVLQLWSLQNTNRKPLPEVQPSGQRQKWPKRPRGQQWRRQYLRNKARPWWLLAVVNLKEENLRWGKSIFSVVPQPWRQGPSDADASEYSMPYLPVTSNCRQLFYRDVVTRSYTTVPVAAFSLPFLSIFTNLEVQERYLPIIRGAGAPFPCISRHFNHWLLNVNRKSYVACRLWWWSVSHNHRK